MYDLVVIGSPAFDRIIRNSMQSNGRTLSGPAITTTVTSFKLGIEHMVFVGSLSSEFTPQLVSNFDSLGIPEHYTIESPETGGFDIEYNGREEPVFTNVLGIPKVLGIRDIPEEFLSSKIIILSPLLQEIDAELVEWICNSSDALVLLDRSFIDYIFPNELDAFLITGETDPYVAAEIIVDSIADNCIIILDSQGSLLYDGKKFSIIPSQTIEVCDSNGAGAAFVAGFAFGLLSNQQPADCAALGTSAAGFKLLGNGIDFQMDQSQVQSRAVEIALDIETR